MDFQILCSTKVYREGPIHVGPGGSLPNDKRDNTVGIILVL